VAADKYENLATMFMAKVAGDETRRDDGPLLLLTIGHIVANYEAFKRLPGHERNYVPYSEYLYKKVQPSLDDLIFLGRDYDRVFDRFELLRALVYADLLFDERKRVWGPIGRFGWKRSRRGDGGPFTTLLSEATELQDQWGPIKAGLFRGKFSRFEQIATGFGELLGKLNWF